MTTTTTMKAMALKPPGEASLVEIAKPSIKDDGEILVRVHSTAVDTAVNQTLNTWLGRFTHAATDPLVIGWHFSGTVEELGSTAAASTDRKEGDAVFGHLQYSPETKHGAFGEYIIVPWKDCARKPEKISHDIAAASTVEALTALQALRDVGGLQQKSSSEQDKSVLILGGGGAVGSAAIQIAKRFGAHVTAVCSTKDVDRVKGFGTDVIIDRKQQNPLAGDETFDIIFDTPSAYTVTAALKKLKRKGTYVSTVPTWSWLGLYIMSFFYGKTVGLVGVVATKEDLDLVASWLEDGFVTEIDSTYPIKDLGAALEYHGGSRKPGRVVMHVKEGW